MSGKSNSGSSGNSFTPYTVTGSGTNSQGNSYDTRSSPEEVLTTTAIPVSPVSDEQTKEDNRFQEDGSYYYANSDNSTYYNSGSGTSGSATYTAPNSNVYKK